MSSNTKGGTLWLGAVITPGGRPRASGRCCEVVYANRKSISRYRISRYFVLQRVLVRWRCSMYVVGNSPQVYYLDVPFLNGIKPKFCWHTHTKEFCWPSVNLFKSRSHVRVCDKRSSLKVHAKYTHSLYAKATNIKIYSRYLKADWIL